jgi:AhpD family alkylhydroperoxidase
MVRSAPVAAGWGGRAGLDYWSAQWLGEGVGVICLRVCVGLHGPVGVTCAPGEWLSHPGAGTGELFLPARGAGADRGMALREGITMNTTVSRATVEADIKETLGLVPHFFSAIPDQLLAPEWEIFKRIELGQTLIPNKYKELIGVGLHAETKCHYCTLFHTEAAKLFGATDEEIQEAVHYAKTSLGWSAYINGMREDYDGFAAELAQIGQYLQSKG